METNQPLRIGVLGASGKMGSLVCREVQDAPDMELVAKVGRGDDRAPLREASVIVDFTRHDVVMDNIRWGIGQGIHMVVGTSGFDDVRLAEVASMVADASTVGVMVIPNFSLSAVLAMSFVAKAARYCGLIDIVDLAHRSKADAPSGSALRTAQMVASERARLGLLPAPDDVPPDSAGTRGLYAHGTRIHSIRLDGLVSHQKVLMGREGEMLTVCFDTVNRSAFMQGVLMAVREVSTRPGLTVGLESLLDL